MFRKEGLEEIKADIERAKDIHTLKGIATAMHRTTVYAAEEIERLKAELEMTKKVIEQADLKNRFDVIQDRIYENYQDGDYYSDKEKCPELYAHLAGRGK